MNLSKKPQLRNAAYLAWVREQPSVESGNVPCVAHHVISERFSSEKTSDYLAIPLTDAEHKRLHESWKAWEKLHGPQRSHSANTLVRAISQGFAFPTAGPEPSKPRPAQRRGTSLSTSKNLPRRGFT